MREWIVTFHKKISNKSIDTRREDCNIVSTILWVSEYLHLYIVLEGLSRPLFWWEFCCVSCCAFYKCTCEQLQTWTRREPAKQLIPASSGLPAPMTSSHMYSHPTAYSLKISSWLNQNFLLLKFSFFFYCLHFTWFSSSLPQSITTLL